MARVQLGQHNDRGHVPVSVDGDRQDDATLQGSTGRWKWNRLGKGTRYGSKRSFLTREAALADLVREHDAEQSPATEPAAANAGPSLAQRAADTQARQHIFDALHEASQQLIPVTNDVRQLHGDDTARELAIQAADAVEKLKNGELEPSEAIQQLQKAIDGMQRALRGQRGSDSTHTQNLLRLARENVSAARQSLSDLQNRSNNGGVRGSRPDVLADVPAQRGGQDADQQGVRDLRAGSVEGDRGGDRQSDGRVGAASEGGDGRSGARPRAEVSEDAGPGAGAAGDGLRDAEGTGHGEPGHAARGAAGPLTFGTPEQQATAPSFEPPAGGDTLAPSSPVNRAKANIAAIEILHRLEAENRPATPEEQKELARYSGWGAVPQIFKPQPDAQFAPLAEKLRSLLTDQEWADARANTLNAHYTDPKIVQQVWSAVEGLGFDGGMVLEPGSGVGNFIGYAPDGADMTGVEVDPITARIAKALYPHSEVRHESFGETRAPNGTFDMAIGNVPFGRYKVPDLVHNKGGHSIHNHFILKSLDLTRGGGLVAVVTSALTMDGHGKKSEAARMEMAEKGELVGAIRLPSGAHQRTAGTSVMTDLLIFRRRDKDKKFTTGRNRKGEVKRPSERTQNDPPMWVHSLPTYALPGQTPPKGDVRLESEEPPVFYNSYFHDHPEQVLGKLAVGHGLHRDNELRVDGDGDLIHNLNRALKRTVAAAKDAGLGYQADPEGRRKVELLPPGSDRVDGHVQAEPDGTFTQVRDGMVHPFPVPKVQADEARQLLAIRDTFQALLAEESRKDADESLIERLRQALNDQYEAYFNKHGAINRFTWAKRSVTDPDTGQQVQKAYRKKAQRGGLFSKDPTMANISPLDEYDDQTGQTTRAAIFTKRQGTYREIAEHADDPQDALAIVLERDGKLTADGLARVMQTHPEDAKARLLAARSVDPDTDVEYPMAFQAPDGSLVTAADYLSGNVRDKLHAAREAAADDPRYDLNVEHLERVLPPDLSTGEIAAPMGASWIGREAVEQFLRETLGSDQIKVSWQGGSLWAVDAPTSVKKAIAYRTKDTWSARGYDALKIAEAILTNRKIVVSEKTSEGVVFDSKATEDAKTKAELLKEEFTDWLWSDPDRADKYKTLYNHQFNSMAPRSYDGQRRTIPGLVEWFKPHPHQHAAVARMVNEPSVLLAHEVGAGKTAEMAMGVMELRRLGLIKKAAIVVPGHMLEQFRHEFAEIFPESVANNRILSASSDDLAGKGRREFIARAAAGDYDAIILTQTAFESIQMRPEVQESYIARRVERLEEKIRRQKELDGEDNDTRLVKRMENSLKALQEKLDKKLSGLKDAAGLHFEDMGVDYLVVDEAHMYKNLDTPSSIAAIDGSNRASDLEMKLEYLRERSPSHRVVTFATATPVANSIAEVHTMMRYLRPDLLEQLGLMDFDDFASTFGQMVTAIERSPDGSYKEKVRLAAFQNVPELLRLWRAFADVKTSEDLDLPVPGIAGGKAVTITMPMSEAQEAYEETIKARAARLESGNVDPREDNHLKLLGDGRMAALDPRLLDSSLGGGNKLPTVADNIARIHEQTKDAVFPTSKTDPTPHETPGGLQIVFLDLGTPKDPGKTKKRKQKAGADGEDASDETEAAAEDGEAYTDFSTYDELKKLLIARGIPSEKIRFIHEAKDDAAKARLFHDARTGKVSVLLGSTAKMGTGTNVQLRATALHHVDAPWRPADVEQRNGRVIRQGNYNDEVAIFQYATERSTDAKFWEAIARKARFIRQLMRGSLSERVVEDIGEIKFDADEASALVAGDPHLIAQAQIKPIVQRLRARFNAYQRSQEGFKRAIRDAELTEQQTGEMLATLQAAADKRKPTRGEDFNARIGKTEFAGAEGREKARSAFNASLRAVLADGQRRPYDPDHPATRIGQVGGLDVTAQFVREYNPYKSRYENAVKVEIPAIPGGWYSYQDHDLVDVDGKPQRLPLMRVEDSLAGIETRMRRQENMLADKKRAAAQASNRVGKPFELADEYDSASRQLEILNEIMRLKAQPPGGEADNKKREASIGALDGELRAMLGEEDDVLAQVAARDLDLTPKTPAPPAITQDDKGRVRFVWPTTEARDAERDRKLAEKREAFLARSERRQQDAPAQPDALGMDEAELTAETDRLAGLISRDEASEADVVRHAGLQREQQRRAKKRRTEAPAAPGEQSGDTTTLNPEQVRSDLNDIAPDGEQTTADTAPADTTPAEETPVDEPAADGAPVDETPAEDTPAPEPEAEQPAAEPTLSKAQIAALDSALNSAGPELQVDGHPNVIKGLVRRGYAEERSKPSSTGRGRTVRYYVLTPEGERRARALREARDKLTPREEPDGIAGTAPQQPTPRKPAAPQPTPRPARTRQDTVRPFASDREWRSAMGAVEGAQGEISRAAQAAWGRDGDDAVRSLRNNVFEAVAAADQSDFEDAAGALAAAQEDAQNLRRGLSDSDRPHMEAPLDNFMRIADDYLARHAVTSEKRRREDAEQGRLEQEAQERFRRSLRGEPEPEATQEPTPDAAPAAAAEPTPEAAPEPESTQEPAPEAEPTPEPAPERTPEPTQAPAPAEGSTTAPRPQRQRTAPSDVRPVPSTRPADMDTDALGEEVDSLDERLDALKESTDPVDLAYRKRLEQRRFELEDEERRRWKPTPEYDENGKVIPLKRGEVIRDRLAGYGLNDEETRGLAHTVEDLPEAKPGGYSDDEWARIDAEASAREAYPPTDEQRVIIEGAAHRGLNMAVMALAGTGKSSTLKMLSHRMPGKKIVYLAFNRSVAAEAREAQARGEYAKNLTAATANGYAAKVADKRLNQRLPGNGRGKFKKLSAQQIADRMRWFDTVKAGNRELTPGGAATVAERMIREWAKSADSEMQPKHIQGAKTAQERRELFNAVKPLADRMWANLTDPEAGDLDRDLTMDFDYIVKMWALGGYKIDADTLMWDEAQDVNPVMEGVVRGALAQGVQVIAVGDSNQAIYGFRGASDALTKIPVDARATLTQSFRFGPAVADVGNRFLRLLGTRMRLKGFDRKQSRLGELKPGDETMVIARTNAGVALAAVQALAAGRTVAVSGGVKDLQEFVTAARALANGDRTEHAELARFNGMPYDDILEAVKADPDLQQLASLFNLLEKHGDEIDKLMESGASAADTENVGGRVWVTLDWNDPKTNDLKRWLGDAKTNGVGKLLYDPGSRRYYYEPGKRDVPWKNERTGRKGVHKVDNRLSLEDAQQKIDAHLSKLYPQVDDAEGGRLVPEDKPHDVLVTTAHKSKGLESARVRIADDFKGPELKEDGSYDWDAPNAPDDEGLRTAYVAVTRATDVLDPGSLGYVFDIVRGDDPTQPPTGEYRRNWMPDDFKSGDQIVFQSEDGAFHTGEVAKVDAPGLVARWDEDGQQHKQYIGVAQVSRLNGQKPPLLPVASDEELNRAISDGRYPSADNPAPVTLDPEQVRNDLAGLQDDQPAPGTTDNAPEAPAAAPEPTNAPESTQEWAEGDEVVTPERGAGTIQAIANDQAAVLTRSGVHMVPLSELQRPEQDSPEVPATAESSAAGDWQLNDWVVTPNGEGRVILANDGDGKVVVLDGGGAPRTYEPRQLSLPGEARTAEHDAPTAQEAARAEKRQRDLEAAQTPEGLKLFYGGRLANLDLEEGHGQVLDEDGNPVGWIRRRGTVWRGQDARGGFATGATAETPSNPLHAPQEAAQSVDNQRGDDKMPVPLKDTTWRHLTPEEGKEEVWYSEFSDAQREQFFQLVKGWAESSDPELRDAARHWGMGGLNYRQMNRLAEETTATADGIDTSTPEGRRQQAVLRRLADKIRAQAGRAWLNWQTMPPPGEPDARGNHDNPEWVPYGHRGSTDEQPVQLDAAQVRNDLAGLQDDQPAPGTTANVPEAPAAAAESSAPEATSEQSRYGGDMVAASEIHVGDWVHAVGADPAYNEPMHLVGKVKYATPLSNGQVRIEVESHINLRGSHAVRTEMVMLRGSDLVERLPEGNPGREDTSDLEHRIENAQAMRLAAKKRVPEGWKAANGYKIQPEPGDRFRIRVSGGTDPKHMNVVVDGPADRDGYWRVKNQPLTFRTSDIVAVPDTAPADPLATLSGLYSNVEQALRQQDGDDLSPMTQRVIDAWTQAKNAFEAGDTEAGRRHLGEAVGAADFMAFHEGTPGYASNSAAEPIHRFVRAANEALTQLSGDTPSRGEKWTTYRDLKPGDVYRVPGHDNSTVVHVDSEPREGNNAYLMYQAADLDSPSGSSGGHAYPDKRVIQLTDEESVKNGKRALSKRRAFQRRQDKYLQRQAEARAARSEQPQASGDAPEPSADRERVGELEGKPVEVGPLRVTGERASRPIYFGGERIGHLSEANGAWQANHDQRGIVGGRWFDGYGTGWANGHYEEPDPTRDAAMAVAAADANGVGVDGMHISPGPDATGDEADRILAAHLDPRVNGRVQIGDAHRGRRLVFVDDNIAGTIAGSRDRWRVVGDGGKPEGTIYPSPEAAGQALAQGSGLLDLRRPPHFHFPTHPWSDMTDAELDSRIRAHEEWLREDAPKLPQETPNGGTPNTPGWVRRNLDALNAHREERRQVRARELEVLGGEERVNALVNRAELTESGGNALSPAWTVRVDGQDIGRVRQFGGLYETEDRDGNRHQWHDQDHAVAALVADHDEREKDSEEEDDGRRRRRNRPNGGGMPGSGGGLPGSLPNLPHLNGPATPVGRGADGHDGGRHGSDTGQRDNGTPVKAPVMDSAAAAQHFGSAEKLRELADQATVVDPVGGSAANLESQVWLNGHKVGDVTPFNTNGMAYWDPNGEFTNPSLPDRLKFADKDAAVAEIVRQAQEFGSPATDVLPPTLRSAAHAFGPPESADDQDWSPEDKQRYLALRDLLTALEEGRPVSGNAADDVSHAIDELDWVASNYKNADKVYWRPALAAESLRRLLDTIQPDNPRAAHHRVSRDRAAWKALRELEKSDALPTPAAIDDLKAGDVIRVKGLRNGEDYTEGKYSGYLREAPKKVTRKRYGVKTKEWSLRLGITPWDDTRETRLTPGSETIVTVPADAMADLLARADDVNMPRENYGTPNGQSDTASVDGPSADAGSLPEPTPGAGRQVPTAKELKKYEDGTKEHNITPEGERLLFGSPEHRRELASQAEVVTNTATSSHRPQVWRNGRQLGELFAPDEVAFDAPEEPRSWWSEDPFDSSLLARFSSREAAIAYMVLRDMERGEPDLSRVDPRLATSLGRSDVYLGLPGDLEGFEALEGNQEGLARLAGVRELLDALANGVTPSGNVADDLDKAHDELQWLASHWKKPPIVLGSGKPNILGPRWLTRKIGEYLDVLRPEDPRAAHHFDRQTTAERQFLRDFVAGGAEERAVPISADDIREGDIVTLSGRMTRYTGATGRETGYVVGTPKKATITVNKQRQKAWRIVVANELHVDPRMGREYEAFVMPVGSEGKLLARAGDYKVPVDDRPYGMPGDGEQANAPQVSTGEASAPTVGATPDNAPEAAAPSEPGTSGTPSGSAEPTTARTPSTTPAPEAPSADRQAPAADRTADTADGRPQPQAPAPAQPSAPAPADTEQPTQEPSSSTAEPETPAEPEPVGGRPAEWVKVSDVGMGDLVRVDGITKRGTARTLAGYVVDGPRQIPTTRAHKVQDMYRVLIADTPDGKGKRDSVWMPLDAMAARATGDSTDAVDGAPQTGADSDVLTGRISDRVATDASGTGLFPGSLVTDADGHEGVVVGSSAGNAQVQFGDDRTDDAQAPSSLNVTDGGAARPAGWTSDGHRVTPGNVVGDRDGNMLGTVEEVDGDTATVATPDGMTPMPITGLRVIGDTADNSSQPPKVARVEKVGVVNEGDVILMRDGQGEDRAYRVTGFGPHEGLQGGLYRVLLEDVITGEPDWTLTGGTDNSGSFRRLVDAEGNTPDLGPEDTPEPNEPITTHEPAPAVAPVTGPAVDPQLSPEERDAIADRGTAPGDDTDAEQAAARIGQDLPVTPDQAQALADGLREGADMSTPEGRAAKRAADRLDQAAGQPGADSTADRPEPGTVGSVGVGDTIALPDESDPNTMSAYSVVGVSNGAGGQRILRLEDADGNRTTRALPASDTLFQLPEANAPAADGDTESRDPNPGLDTEAFTADFADQVARAVVDAAINGTTNPGSIHQLRQQIAEKVTPEALRSAMRKLRQDAVAVVDGNGITGDERERVLANLRRAAMQSRVDAVRAAVRTLDDLEPLDGESPDNMAKRAADLLRLIPEALRNRMPEPDAADSSDNTTQVADEVSNHVDNAVSAAMQAAADTGLLTPQRRAEIVAGLARSMEEGRQDAAQQIAAHLPEGQRPGIISQIVAALAQIARRVVELVAAFLKGIAAGVKNVAAAINRFRKGIARRIRSWPETRRLRRLAAADRSLPRPGDGMSLAERVGHWVRLLPAPDRFGQVARRRRWYRPTSRAALAAGQLPGVQDGVRWVMDRDADRGPGRQTLRQLAALRAAGTDIDADVMARLTAAAPELGDDPHGAVRHARRYQERAEARARDLRAVAAGRNAPDLSGEIAAADVEAQHAQQEADRLHRAYSAALPAAVRASLSEVREMGPGGRDRMTLSHSSDPAAARALGEAARYVPRDWLADRNARFLTAVSGDEGGYDPDNGIARVADLGDGGLSTAAFALAQHLQQHAPDLQAAQEAFAFSRTHTGRPGARRSAVDVLLSRLFGGRAGEPVIDHEIAARALAEMFSGDWYRDDDLRAFLLGLLATR